MTSLSLLGGKAVAQKRSFTGPTKFNLLTTFIGIDLSTDCIENRDLAFGEFRQEIKRIL